MLNATDISCPLMSILPRQIVPLLCNVLEYSIKHDVACKPFRDDLGIIDGRHHDGLQTMNVTLCQYYNSSKQIQDQCDPNKSLCHARALDKDEASERMQGIILKKEIVQETFKEQNRPYSLSTAGKYTLSEPPPQKCFPGNLLGFGITNHDKFDERLVVVIQRNRS
ncbi:hypothetical protein J6590_028082 [Homalodisca vitripennis]|nr:hypothetical protein J6590_028082 [Homalodisca vitripennis]